MKVFLLEDDPVQASAFVKSLSGTPFVVSQYAKPGPFLRAVATSRPQLMVLDWNLPDVTGLQVLGRVRELAGADIPVVMLTCVQDDASIVAALEAGADDFLVKPVAPHLLRVRLEAIVRRPDKPTELAAVQVGPYLLDYRAQSISIDGQPVSLTPKEFDLMWLLTANRDRFVSKAELVAGVWGRKDLPISHAVAQHIYAMRKKLRLKDYGFRISAVYGCGYRLEAVETPCAAMDEVHGGAHVH